MIDKIFNIINASFSDYLKEMKIEFSRFLSCIGGIPFYFFIVLVFLISGIEKNINLSLFLLIGFIILSIIGSFLRLIFFRERPERREYKSLYKKIKASSFPSMHITRFLFMGLTIYFFYPLKSFLIFLIILTILMGIDRVKKKRHFYSDILGGIIFTILFFLIFVKINLI